MKQLSARQWLRHSFVYAFGIGLQSALALFVVPIYTRRLPPPQYGVLELLTRTQDILALVAMSGLAVAVVAFYQFEAGSERQKSVFSTALTAVVVNSVILWAILLPLAPALSRYVLRDAGYAWAVRLFLLIVPLELTFQVGLVALQAQYKSGLFGLFSGGRFAVGILVNIVLVLWLDLGLRGIIFSTLCHTALAAVAITIYLFRELGWSSRWDLWKAMLCYGAPFIAGGLLRIVLDSGDRYFLIAYSGAAAVGVYAISYKLVLALSTLILMPFAKVWGASMVRIGNDPNGSRSIARAMTYLTFVYLYAGLVLSLLSPAIVRWFTGPRYWDAYKPLPVLVLAYLFFGMTLVADTAFYAKKKTKIKPWIMAVACVACLGLYAGLIPRWGAMGAAVATLGGFAILAFTTIVVAQRILPTTYETRRLALLLVLSCGLFLTGRLACSALRLHEALVSTGAFIAFPALLYICNFLRADERAAVSQYFNARSTAPDSGQVVEVVRQ